LEAGKGETTFTAPEKQKDCGSYKNCRSRISAPKAAGLPVLAGPDENPNSAGILACAS
jgi:hypothetical protein